MVTNIKSRLIEVSAGFNVNFPRPFRKSALAKNNGVILLSVILILLTIALIGASLMIFFLSVDLFARSVADGAKAFYLAEAGIARAVNVISTRSFAVAGSDYKIGPVDLGEGAYSVRIDAANSLITSIGEVRGTKKTLQLQFNAF